MADVLIAVWLVSPIILLSLCISSWTENNFLRTLYKSALKSSEMWFDEYLKANEDFRLLVEMKNSKSCSCGSKNANKKSK